MRLTLLLSAVLVLSYFALSSGFFYIPDSQMISFSFSWSNPLGIFSYSFVHIGLTHLLGNLFLLLPLGFVVESKLKPKDFLAIYFSSAVLAALLFAAVMPNVVLVGASAAIAGLVIPACFIDFKKTVLYVAVFTIIAVLLTFAAGFAVSQAQNEARNRVVALGEELNKTAAEKNETAGQIQDTEDKYRKGEITQEQYSESKQELTQKMENLTAQETAITEESNTTAAFEFSIQYGRDREEVAKTSTAVHVVGSLWGLLYLYLFRRSIIYNSGKQFAGFQRWLSRRNRI